MLAHMTTHPGTVVFLGGSEARSEGLARSIAELAPSRRAAVVPLAAAFEGPEAAVVEAAGWLAAAGFEVEGVMAASRTEADQADLAGRIADSGVVLLLDGAAMHLRTALKGTAMLAELEALLERGGVLVAEGSSASVLCDPMVDPRGGAPTVGIGLVDGVTTISHLSHEPEEVGADKLARSAELLDPGIPLLSLKPEAAVVIGADGRVRSIGAVPATCLKAGAEVALDALDLS